MLQLPLLNIEAASPEAQPILVAMRQDMGFVPNIASLLANSPKVLTGFAQLVGAFSQSTFNAQEQAVVLLTASVENDCHYCASVHTSDIQVSGLDRDIALRIRERRRLSEPHLEALRATTELLVRRRGYLTEAQMNAFYQAGYQPAQLLEVILGISLKTLSNTVNHLAETPVDKAFRPHAYTPRLLSS